jgi:hypothetical protein
VPQFKVYLPTQAVGYDTALHTVQEHFCQWYGGFTQWRANGGYQNANGEIVTEPVTVMMADYNDVDGHTENIFRDEINPLGKSLRRDLPDEESIMLVVDGKKYSY